MHVVNLIVSTCACRLLCYHCACPALLHLLSNHPLIIVDVSQTLQNSLSFRLSKCISFSLSLCIKGSRPLTSLVNLCWTLQHVHVLHCGDQN